MKSKIKKFINILLEPINRIYFKIFIYHNKKTILNNNDICGNFSGKNILILAPHVDDETIGCGGAILKYKKQEKNVSICYLTRSQKRGSKSSSKDIEAERKEEAYKLAKEIGIPKKNIFFVSGEDGNLRVTDIKNEFLDVIGLVKPDTVFLPVFLDTHIDHHAASIKLVEAFDSRPDLFKDVEVFSYESQSPLTPLYSNKILDITDVYNRKIELLDIFESQNIDAQFVKNTNRINGMAKGIKAGEAFINMPIDEYVKFIKSSKFTSEEEFLNLRKKLVQNRDNLTLIKSYKSSLKYKKDYLY